MATYYINGIEHNTDEDDEEYFRKNPLTKEEIREITDPLYHERMALPNPEPTRKELDNLSDFANELQEEYEESYPYNDEPFDERD